MVWSTEEFWKISTNLEGFVLLIRIRTLKMEILHTRLPKIKSLCVNVKPDVALGLRKSSSTYSRKFLYEDIDLFLFVSEELNMIRKFWGNTVLLHYYRSQTTQGIWVAKCVGIEPCTIAMDLEGTDRRERGEMLQHFRSKVLFLLWRFQTLYW